MAQARTAGGSRPRNAAATKELLLAAATEEFAEFGLAGARIDRIAERAGANKRLLYVYFGDKERLFTAVLRRHVGELSDAVPLARGDLVAFAGGRFDYLLANPQVARLTAWRVFERVEPAEEERRRFQAKVDAVARAQREGRLWDGMAAVDMFAIVLRMIESWLSVPPALAAVAGVDPLSPGRLEEHRRALLDAVRRFTAPR